MASLGVGRTMPVPGVTGSNPTRQTCTQSGEPLGTQSVTRKGCVPIVSRRVGRGPWALGRPAPVGLGPFQ